MEWGFPNSSYFVQRMFFLRFDIAFVNISMFPVLLKDDLFLKLNKGRQAINASNPNNDKLKC